MARWLSLLMALFLVQPAAALMVDSMAAVVDGQVVTRSQVEEFLAQGQATASGLPKASQEKQALEELIERALVEREADRLGIDATDEEVGQAVKDIRARNGLDPDAFRQAVTAQGMTYEGYLREVRFQILRAKVASRVLKSRLRVGDEALREYYLKNVAEYREPESVRLCQIQVPDSARERAEGLRKRALAGESPEKLAEEASRGRAGPRSGDTGFVPLRNLSKQVRDAIAGLPKGGVSPVVELGGVCGFFEVLERKEGRIPPFEEVRDRIREAYFKDTEEELYRTWIESLKEKARIERKM